MLRITPPLWARHLIPMRLLQWVDNYTGWCWASVALWKLGYGALNDSWWPVATCFGDKDARYDYCGKYDDTGNAEFGYEGLPPIESQEEAHA